MNLSSHWNNLSQNGRTSSDLYLCNQGNQLNHRPDKILAIAKIVFKIIHHTNQISQRFIQTKNPAHKAAGFFFRNTYRLSGLRNFY
jgi:hypothetical protein